MSIRILGAVVSIVAVVAAAPVAYGSYPGVNGRLAFTRTLPPDARTTEIYTMSPDGTAVTRVTENSVPEDKPLWSPDGRKIAFVQSGIRVMNADGTGNVALVAGTDPAWSPDGTRIAFSAGGGCEFDECFESDIFVVNADGTGRTRLTDSNGLSERFLDWSPDGTKISFSALEKGGWDIWTIGMDGTGLTRLTSDPAFDYISSWSPDGRRLVFQSHRDEEDRFGCGSRCNSEIYAMNADGSEPTRLTSNPARDEAAVWSPDGAKIAFARFNGCTFGCSSSDIYTMNSNGTGEVNLTNNPARVFDFKPNWQPLPPPQVHDYKNAAAFCKAERERLGEAEFARRYGTNGNGANAFGKCVSRSR